MSIKIYQSQQFNPEYIEYMIPNTTKHINLEHKHYVIKAKYYQNLTIDRLFTLSWTRVLTLTRFSKKGLEG